MKNGEDLRDLTMLPLSEIQEAQQKISGTIIQTPIVELVETEETTGPKIYLKLENLQKTGAFKLRGAANALAHVDPAELSHGVYTTSTGNFARALATVAHKRRIPCTVVCPHAAQEAKVGVARKLGAEIRRTEPDVFWKAMFEKKLDLDVPGTFVHPCCNRLVIAGNGTVGLEIFSSLPEVDAVVIPYGGGGLSTGVASALRQLKPEVTVYACEVETAAPLTASRREGSPVWLSDQQYKPSWVDGMAGKTVFSDMWNLITSLIDGVLTVSEGEISTALTYILHNNKLLVEGAAAATVAAVWKYREELVKHKNVVCVMSGGNLDDSILMDALQGKIL